MTGKINSFLYWTPRILSILFAVFLALFSLDVIGPEKSFVQVLLGLFMHNIPVFILISIIMVSWKHEIVGAIAFTIASITYTAWVILRGIPWHPIVAGPAFLIAILFWVGWRKKQKKT